MINIAALLVRYIPLLEKLVATLWADYEEWRKKYDEERIKASVSKALVDNSTDEINKELNKR